MLGNKPPKERTMLSIKYKRGNALYPVTQNLDHLNKNALVKEMELREQGTVDRDGKTYHFQTIRFLIEVLP